MKRRRFTEEQIIGKLRNGDDLSEQSGEGSRGTPDHGCSSCRDLLFLASVRIA